MSWRSDTRWVYTFGTTNCAWQFYEEFSLTDGQFYTFRVHRIAGNELRTSILWDGQWTVLKDYNYNGPHCMDSGGRQSARRKSMWKSIQRWSATIPIGTQR